MLSKLKIQFMLSEFVENVFIKLPNHLNLTYTAEPDAIVPSLSLPISKVEAEEKLANAIADNIFPPLMPEIETISFEGKAIIVIRVVHWKGPF